MIIYEDGNIKTFDAAGNKLREGTFEVTNYDGTRHDVGGNPWDLGKFTTNTPAILYPYMINGGGKLVTYFEILGLTNDQLCLVYPGESAPGAWAEATFWRFKAVENEDLLYKDWTWVLTHADLVKNSLSAVLTSGGAANLKCFGMTAKAVSMAIPTVTTPWLAKVMPMHT